ncbi:MAG: hypothetical protein ACO1PB_13475 [Ramlibacter sp.]
MHPLNLKVEHCFAAWQERRQRLQDRSRALEAALAAFAHGGGPEPSAQKAEVEVLRAECDALFAEVLAAVAAAKAAGVR